MTYPIIAAGFGAFVALSFPALTASAADAPQPVACAQLDTDIPAAYAPWRQPAKALPAATTPAGLAATTIQVGKKYALTLAPESAVTLQVATSAMHSTNPHAGMAKLTIPQDGLYHVVTSKRGRIDIASGGDIAPAETFAERFTCTSFKKVVDFQLKSGEATLELSSVSGDADNVIEVMIVRQP